MRVHTKIRRRDPPGEIYSAPVTAHPRWVVSGGSGNGEMSPHMGAFHIRVDAISIGLDEPPKSRREAPYNDPSLKTETSV